MSLLRISYFKFTHFFRLKILTCSKSIAELARKSQLKAVKLRGMVADGTRLLYLSLCSELFLFSQCHFILSHNIIIGSPYILALLAITSQMNTVCQKTVTNDIASLGMYLRRVPGMFLHLFIHLKMIMRFI